MADIVVEVHDQEALAPSSAMPTEDLDVQWIEVDGRRFTVSDDELTPEEARDLARASRLVVWDSCGCRVAADTRSGRGRRLQLFSRLEFRR